VPFSGTAVSAVTSGSGRPGGCGRVTLASACLLPYPDSPSPACHMARPATTGIVGMPTVSGRGALLLIDPALSGSVPGCLPPVQSEVSGSQPLSQLINPLASQPGVDISADLGRVNRQDKCDRLVQVPYLQDGKHRAESLLLHDRFVRAHVR